MKMQFELDRLKRFIPVVVPLAVLAVGYFGLVQPRFARARAAAADVRALEPRLAQARVMAQAAPVDPRKPGSPDVELRVPTVDRIPDLLERLARLGMTRTDAGEIRNLLIETGDRLLLSTPTADARPSVAGTVELPDPRFALFGAALAYTPVTVSFEASYARLGRFLWDLRELPTTIEIRSLAITRPGADGFVQVTLVVFAYQRVDKTGDSRRSTVVSQQSSVASPTAVMP